MLKAGLAALLIVLGPLATETHTGRIAANGINAFILLAATAAVGRTTLSFVIALLLAIGGETGAGPFWLLTSLLLLAGFAYVERRVSEPILPVEMFRSPLIARSNIVAFLFGVAMFGAIAFIPLFVQAVLG